MSGGSAWRLTVLGILMERNRSLTVAAQLGLRRGLMERSETPPHPDKKRSQSSRPRRINATVTEPRPSGSGFPKTVKHPGKPDGWWEEHGRRYRGRKRYPTL